MLFLLSGLVSAAVLSATGSTFGSTPEWGSPARDTLRPEPGRRGQRDVPYTPAPWKAELWPSTPPEGSPFEPSSDIKGLAFTHRWVAYTDADTWYPSWASDGNLYSGWTDGEIGEESVHSSGRAKARTGDAVIIGDDPLHLEIKSLGSYPGSAEPYGGRYPSANLVHNGI